MLRAEIEALRSGTDSETVQKITALESTIETLESSHDRLSQAHESEKRKTVEVQNESKEKVECLLREQNAQVNSITYPEPVLISISY